MSVAQNYMLAMPCPCPHRCEIYSMLLPVGLRCSMNITAELPSSACADRCSFAISRMVRGVNRYVYIWKGDNRCLFKGAIVCIQELANQNVGCIKPNLSIEIDGQM